MVSQLKFILGQPSVIISVPLDNLRAIKLPAQKVCMLQTPIFMYHNNSPPPAPMFLKNTKYGRWLLLSVQENKAR